MPRVGIFWDYENCKPPPKMSGYTVVEKIRQAALPFGSVSLFKAYMDVNSRIAEVSRQEEIQNSGVSLVHTPLSAKKEVTDKILLVDLLVFAFENQGPTSIILITADRDITYALSVLRLRGHQVVVISPAESAYCQGDANYPLNTCLDWKLDVLESDDPAAKTRCLSTKARSWRTVAEGCARAQPAESASAENSVCSRTNSTNKGRPYLDSGTGPSTEGKVYHSRSSHIQTTRVYSDTEPASHDEAGFRADIENPFILRRNGNPADGKTWGEPYHANVGIGFPGVSKGEKDALEDQGNRSLDIEETVNFEGLNVRGDGTNVTDSDVHVPSIGILSAVEESVHESSDADSMNMAETVPASPEERFKVLIEVLMNQQRRGYSFTSSVDLDALLLRADPNVYEDAHVGGLKKYLKLARQENVVFFSGKIKRSQEAYVFLRWQQTSDTARQMHFGPLLNVLKVWASSGCKQVPFGLLERHIDGLNPDAVVKAGAIDFKHYVLLAVSAGLVRVDLPALSWVEFVRRPSASNLAGTSPSQSSARTDSSTETASVRSVQTAPTVHSSVSSSTLSKTSRKAYSNFATLVDVLREERERGVYEVKRWALSGVLLNRDPQIYRRMGIETSSTIKGYVAKALAAGIVVLGEGGKGGKKVMVQLHPDYY